MNPSCIYSIKFYQSRHFRLHCIPRHFVNEFTKTSILLWWPPNYSKSPNSIFLRIYFLHFHERKIMSQTIITKMVTKWSFGFIFFRINFTSDDKICIHAYNKSFFILVPESSSTKNSCKLKFTKSFR